MDNNNSILYSDIVCVGFGPATAGFLTAISKKIYNEDGSIRLYSPSQQGMPLQILCYERADDISFAVSGVASKATFIKNFFTTEELKTIPMSAEITKEKLVYLLDPIGVSQRPFLLKVFDFLVHTFKWIFPYNNKAFIIPFCPSFLKKDGGMVFSLGQFLQYVGTKLMSSGNIQIWPGSPVNEPIIKDNKVIGIRLIDYGVDKNGNPTEHYIPPMEVHALLTVVGDGPYGYVGRKLNEVFGVPSGFAQHDWAIGMKFVVDLPSSSKLKEGTVIHTFGYPEPEIFGFLYALSSNIATCGIFVQSWYKNPVKNPYRYLQHWMMHPYIWQYLKDSRIRSWGAKSIGEYGLLGQPHVVGDGYVRIGESIGTTNVLTNSGVDEAWMSGVILADAVEELLLSKALFTKANLDKAYINRLKNSKLMKDAQIAKNARRGFYGGFVYGILGMFLAGISKGKLWLPFKTKSSHRALVSMSEYFRGRLSNETIKDILNKSMTKNISLHDVVMDYLGWPKIPYDNKLLVTHQDALLLGGKVQAPSSGYKDHVVFVNPTLCEECSEKICVEICSGQAISLQDDGKPRFDREKCVHCGACFWSCSKVVDNNANKGNIEFYPNPGGLHSSEN